MSKAQKQVTSAPASVDGLDDFFDATPDETPQDPSATTADGTMDPERASKIQSSILSIKQACKQLGIRKKTLYLRISEGVYKTFTGKDGDVRIVLPPETNSVEEAAVTPVTVGAPVAATVIDGAKLAQVIEKLCHQLSQASTRIGYLESQVNAQNEKEKLLPDLRTHISQAVATRKENDDLRQRITELEDELTRVKRPSWVKFVEKFKK